MRLLQEFMHNNAREPEDEDHENIQDKLFSLPGSTMTEIWELCVLSSRSANGPTNIQLAKNIAASIQDSLQNAVKKHPLSRIDAVPSREKAKAALAARKRKYQADKAFQEMDEVFQPLKAEMALYEQGKRRTSNTGTKSVLESFEKRLKEAAKKAEQIGKKRALEDSDDSDSGIDGVKTPPLKTTVAREPRAAKSKAALARTSSAELYDKMDRVKTPPLNPSTTYTPPAATKTTALARKKKTVSFYV